MTTQMSSQPTNVECQTTVADCAAFLKCIKPLAERYEENLKKRNVDIGFNLFELISDHYYRETFHSDILNALLDPTGKHQGGKKYLDIFLNYLRSQHGAEIDLSHYSDAQVVKEEDRIDILIKGCKHAIIIENKINNADDKKKQLPRYLKKVNGYGFACDAIIYLRLNGNLGPDTTGWNDGEFEPQLIEELKRKLKVICAFDDTEKDLLNGWISKCEKESDHLDAHAILRQYGKIIEKLEGNIMNEPNMKEFYNVMVKDDGKNLKTALSLEKMLADLISYRVQKILDKFKDDQTPFDKIGIAENYFDAYFQGLGKHGNLGLDIVVYPDYYSFRFCDKDDPKGKKAEELLQKMKCFDEYTLNHEGGWYCKKFAFPSEEDDLIKHITNFKKNLAAAILID